MIRSCVSWCRNLLYAVIVLALVLCLTEIGLRVYDSATGQVTRRELYDRGMVCKSWSVHHALKPSRTFSVKDPDSDERVRVVINALGLRGPEPVVPKPPDVYRVLCLGDEITLAPQTPESETFCARLQAELAAPDGRRVEVINAGIPDYCPLLSYLQLKHQLLSLAPDLVIVNFEMGDVADDYRIRRQVVMAAGGVPLSCTHPSLEIARPAGATDKKSADDVLLLPLWCRHKLTSLFAKQTLGDQPRSIDAPQGRYRWLEDQPPDWSLHVEHALAPLAHLGDLAGSLGARVVVVCSPAPWQVSADASRGEGVREQAGVEENALYRSRRPFEAIGDFCRKYDLALCDVSGAFQQSDRPERLFLKNAAVLSPAGHALYSQQLARFLERDWRAGATPSTDPDDIPSEFTEVPETRPPSR
ncbi:MAG: SGNH/GDSL hydrolase family protein [Planctomycetaceae bacterium]|nr:SGNH/GDSL hydrolase family protein [Planctomycetaceae bacterium]